MTEQARAGLIDQRKDLAHQLAIDWQAERSIGASLVDVAGMPRMIQHFEAIGFFHAIRTHQMMTMNRVNVQAAVLGSVSFSLPNTVPPLYRGAVAGNGNGMSWTNDHTEARWHANRRGGVIHMCEFEPDDVLAVITDQNPDGLESRSRWASNERSKLRLAASLTISEWVMRPNGRAFPLSDLRTRADAEFAIARRNEKVLVRAMSAATAKLARLRGAAEEAGI